MSTILSISASPQPTSRTHALVRHVNHRLVANGHTVRTLQVRDLPAGPLLSAEVTHPALIEAIAAIRTADALVVATPVYQSAYSGLLKVFLDLLPQFALRGKVVFPLATGGSGAHALALDYALRPLLSALGAAHVTAGWVVPSAHIRAFPDGGVQLDPESAAPIAQVTGEFLATLAVRAAAARPGLLSAARATDLEVYRVESTDPRLTPLLADLVVEHGTRYTSQPAAVPIGGSAESTEPTEAYLILVENGKAPSEDILGNWLTRNRQRTA